MFWNSRRLRNRQRPSNLQNIVINSLFTINLCGLTVEYCTMIIKVRTIIEEKYFLVFLNHLKIDSAGQKVSKQKISCLMMKTTSLPNKRSSGDDHQIYCNPNCCPSYIYIWPSTFLQSQFIINILTLWKGP